MTNSPPLYDSRGRHIHKLRVSLTDKCNFRCFYCMPCNPKFLPSQTLLPPEKIAEICQRLVALGITQIRVSGGEPTYRKDFMDIMVRLSSLPLKKLAVTSNGFLLAPFLPKLKEIGCNHVNISLDTLSKDTFQRIARVSGLDNVHRSILQAKELGLNVKVNVVLLRGVNDAELHDFVAFSADHQIEVRFLELMKIGEGVHLHEERFLSADEAIAIISKKETLSPVNTERDSTSFNFKTTSGASIGFIASETKPFCADCSRLRLSATGGLRGCLMLKDEINLCNIDAHGYIDAIKKAMESKPAGRIPSLDQKMYQIGG